MKTRKKNKNVPDYVHGTFTLASTDILNYCHEGDYEEYREWCKVNDIKPDAEDSPAHWEWRAEMRDVDWENDLDNLKDCREYRVPVVMTGFAERWNGTRIYAPVFFQSVEKAVDRIIGGCDFDDVDIRYEDGALAVYGHHHDGTNRYHLRALSKKGEAKRDSAERRWEDVSDLRRHDFKRLPYLYAL